MMPRRLLAITVIALSLNSCSTDTPSPPVNAPETSPQITYHLAPVTTDDQPAIEVHLTLETDHREATDLLIPQRWASIMDLDRSLQDLATLSDDTELHPTDYTNIIRLTHPPGETVTLRYRVLQTFQGQLYANRYRPLYHFKQTQ